MSGVRHPGPGLRAAVLEGGSPTPKRGRTAEGWTQRPQGARRLPNCSRERGTSADSRFPFSQLVEKGYDRSQMGAARDTRQAWTCDWHVPLLYPHPLLRPFLSSLRLRPVSPPSVQSFPIPSSLLTITWGKIRVCSYQHVFKNGAIAPCVPRVSVFLARTGMSYSKQRSSPCICPKPRESLFRALKRPPRALSKSLQVSSTLPSLGHARQRDTVALINTAPVTKLYPSPELHWAVMVAQPPCRPETLESRDMTLKAVLRARGCFYNTVAPKSLIFRCGITE